MNPIIIIRNAIIFNCINGALSFQMQPSPSHNHHMTSSVDRGSVTAAAKMPSSSSSSSTQEQYRHHQTSTTLFSENNNNDDEFGVGETYEGDVDWDAEWKKVVKNQDQPEERPGKDFYKNDVEKAIGKTAKAAQEQISKIPNVKVEMPKPRVPMSLTGDAKLWLAIIAIVSIGSAVIGASGSINADYTNGGFDI